MISALNFSLTIK